MRARKTARSPDCVPGDGQRPYLMVVVVGRKKFGWTRPIYQVGMTCHSDVANHVTRHVRYVYQNHQMIFRGDTISMRLNTVPSPLFQLLLLHSPPVFERFLPAPVHNFLVTSYSFGSSHYLIQRFSGLKYSEIIWLWPPMPITCRFKINMWPILNGGTHSTT